MTHPNDAQLGHAYEVYHSRWRAVITAQDQALKWLLNINTAGTAGALALASASRETNFALVVALISFSAGMLCLLGYAGIYFYSERRLYGQVSLDHERLKAGEIDYPTFIDLENSRPEHYPICEVLALIGALSCGFGIVAISWVLL